MQGKIDVSEQAPSRSPKTRVFALLTLVTFASGVTYLGREGYRALTDSFVAPIILSPDNDLILQNKIKLAELRVERARTEGDIGAIEADVAGCGKAVDRLKQLQSRTENALVWNKKINAAQASAGSADLRALAEQKAVIEAMLQKQAGLAREAQAEMGAGLISSSDFARESQVSDQFKIAALENQRMRIQAQMQMHQVTLGQQALGPDGHAAPMPEMVAHEDQAVRVELELIKLEAEQRGKLAELKVTREKLATIDELSGQLKARPLFRAVEKSMDIAFVPYTQVEGMREGAYVYDCVWGVFHCKHVGEVAEIVPGEVLLQDPWGSPARGQYAVLELRNRESAKSKTLRVRLDTAPPSAKPSTAPVAVK
jgi:hypothetical protein